MPGTACSQYTAGFYNLGATTLLALRTSPPCSSSCTHPLAARALHAAVRDRTEALVRHLSDSLALLPLIEHHVHNTQRRPSEHSPGGSGSEALRVIDVGTGVWWYRCEVCGGTGMRCTWHRCEVMWTVPAVTRKECWVRFGFRRGCGFRCVCGCGCEHGCMHACQELCVFPLF